MESNPFFAVWPVPTTGPSEVSFVNSASDRARSGASILLLRADNIGIFMTDTGTSSTAPDRQAAAPALIHLVFKTHLDIGFTDHAEAVRKQYHDRFIPQALTTAEHFWREDPENPAFIWTTGAWLIHDYLAEAGPAEVARLEQAIERGLIRWHALPFTTHSELMSPALFRAGLSFGKELDVRFGMHTRAAKMTDVPGHTIGIVPILAKAGVRFLHLGVNTACPVPDLPDLFCWRAPDGSELVVMYQNSYGETQLPDGMVDALSFAHTEDNIGPQSVPQTAEVYRALAKAHPGACIRAATLEEYGALLWERRASLPVVETEIGDSWIHGCASDPEKLARFRQLQRLHDRFEEEGLTPSRLAFGRSLCLVAEHTWGVDIKSYLRDETAWDRSAFDAICASDYRFTFAEASWEEQRRYIDAALSELEPDDLGRAQAVLADLTAPPRITISADGVREIGGWRIEADLVTGGIARLTAPDGRSLKGRDDAPLFAATHQSFDAADIDRHMDSYLIDRPDWAILDHGKPGLSQAETALSARFETEFSGLTQHSEIVEITARMPQGAHDELGAPAGYRWRITPGQSADSLSIMLILEDKPANRMPEAGHVTIAPQGARDWQLEKTGLWIDPATCARRAGGALHGLFAARCSLPDGQLGIRPLDAGLCAPAGHDLMTFQSDPPAWDRGIAFLTYTNKWGTNFPMWWSGDAVFRFELSWPEMSGDS